MMRSRCSHGTRRSAPSRTAPLGPVGAAAPGRRGDIGSCGNAARAPRRRPACGRGRYTSAHRDPEAPPRPFGIPDEAWLEATSPPIADNPLAVPLRRLTHIHSSGARRSTRVPAPRAPVGPIRSAVTTANQPPAVGRTKPTRVFGAEVIRMRIILGEQVVDPHDGTVVVEREGKGRRLRATCATTPPDPKPRSRNVAGITKFRGRQ